MILGHDATSSRGRIPSIVSRYSCFERGGRLCHDPTVEAESLAAGGSVSIEPYRTSALPLARDGRSGCESLPVQWLRGVLKELGAGEPGLSGHSMIRGQTESIELHRYSDGLVTEIKSYQFSHRHRPGGGDLRSTSMIRRHQRVVTPVTVAARLCNR